VLFGFSTLTVGTLDEKAECTSAHSLAGSMPESRLSHLHHHHHHNNNSDIQGNGPQQQWPAR